MPTYFTFSGMKFFFYSNDHEPTHVHVTKGKKGREAQAKFSADPSGEVELIENHGLSSRDLNKALEQIQEKKEEIIEKWRNHFNDDEELNK